MNMSNFVCPYCDHSLPGHSGIFGKVCTRCFKVTDTSKSLRQLLENNHKKSQESIREFLRDKIIRDDYAD